MLHMQPVTINFWPYIGFSAKGGDTEKGSILKQTEVIEKAKEVMGLLVREIEKERERKEGKRGSEEILYFKKRRKL